MGFPASFANSRRELLTRLERKILSLLAEARSQREIAEAEALSPSLVKRYIQQIYGKLGANNRQQALERARSLGLLVAALSNEVSYA
jgi:LuxR family maltose regulon positive regulatory protein